MHRTEPTTDVDVRQACFADLAAVSRALGGTEFFAERLERQKNGRGALFIAWLSDEPVGDVYLWLEAAEEHQVRRNLPGVALLTHLEVLPDFRNRGVGTKLVAMVEDYLCAHGHRRAALAVRDDNGRAAQLYYRLGYRDWGHGKLICFANVTVPGGGYEVAPEPCYFLVKQLTTGQPAGVT
ncbi:MAG TPA: GNAT family N-acetyltransferase [Pseudonocardiaceae bacterium]|nr:GNAT family N-acetyltransferase [Pseudonocardiaceae bacterium]